MLKKLKDKILNKKSDVEEVKEEIVEKNNWVLPSFSNEKIKFGKPG